MVPLPPALEPEPSPADSPAPSQEITAATPSDTPAAAPPSDALPALPVQEVRPRAPHVVTDDQPLPIPHVTIQDRQGRIISRPAPSQTAMAPPAPRSQAPLSSLAPAAGSQRMPEPQGTLQPIPATLSGPAHATGTVSIALDGHQVRLFGVVPPSSTDRCALGRGGLAPCSDVTQEVLAARVARSPSVSCRVPAGLSESSPARICVDASGGDIAGYLVAEGLALADRNTSADYVGAEGIAQSYSKGLWHYR
jgi:endonuclease YncB( thermonuclease family)